MQTAPDPNQNLISIVAICTSGLVALATLISPILVNLVAERMRWARERKAAEQNVIDQATNAVLDGLAPFWTTAPVTPDIIAERTSRYLKWEWIVWSYLSEAERKELADLRSKALTFARGSEDNDPVATRILTLSRNAASRIK